MIKEIVKLWDENKNLLKQHYYDNASQINSLDYSDVVKATVKYILNDPYRSYDINKITEIDDGDYQGTKIYVIPRDTYQPGLNEYLVAHVEYGSCSVCDTLLCIQEDYEDVGEQVDDLMTLSLHIIQSMKYLYENPDTTGNTDLIKQWATDRNLHTAQPEKQMLKLVEEFGELGEGMAKGNRDLIIDSLGDMYVVMTILAMQMDIDISEAIEVAYNEIKDRKGKMIDGVFVKESDL